MQIAYAHSSFNLVTGGALKYVKISTISTKSNCIFYKTFMEFSKALQEIYDRKRR